MNLAARLGPAPSINGALSMPSTYVDPHFRVEAAKILPGEFHVTDKDIALVTVLGSCVSACLRDPRLKLGGMNHFMLPDGGDAKSDPLGSPARYGTHAMELLINEMLKSGARRADLQAKVFGGGAVMPGLASSQVGERNAAFVLAFLKDEGIPVLASDLLDIYPRKLYFFPRTGQARVKRLPTQAEPVVRSELDYRARLSATRLDGDVDLFS